MKTLVKPSLIVALLSFTALTGKAQSHNGTITLQPPPANITIDGDLKEWGDSLRYYNAEKKINFSLANDQQNLYMAVRINDRSEQMRIMNAGLTLSIDPKGKKKETFSMTFPLPQTDAFGNFEHQHIENPDSGRLTREEIMQERLTKLRTIKVTGFKDVENDIITTSNSYGFKAAINIDANGYLVYEAAIPLAMFHVDDLTKNEWAFNFKINGITRPQNRGGEGEGQGDGMGGRGGMGGSRGGRGGGMGGMGGGRGGRGGMGGNRGGMSSADRSEMSKSIDFWEKFYLAK